MRDRDLIIHLRRGLALIVLAAMTAAPAVTEEPPAGQFLESGSHRIHYVDWGSGQLTVEPGDAAGTERLARYLLRPPLSLERMSFDATGTVRYRRKASSRFGRGAITFDPLDFLARLLMHIPEPRLHTVRYYGEYSSVARARRRAEAERFEADRSQAAAADASDTLSPAERRRLRRSWAELIRRIYEVDPLTCECGARMCILAFILDPQDITRILRHIDTEGTTDPRAPPPSPSLALRPSLTS